MAEFYRSLREEASPPVDASAALVTVRLLEQVRDALADKQKRRVTVGNFCSSARVLVTGATAFSLHSAPDNCARGGSIRHPTHTGSGDLAVP